MSHTFVDDCNDEDDDDDDGVFRGVPGVFPVTGVFLGCFWMCVLGVFNCYAGRR